MMFWYGEHWAWWQGGLMWLGMIVFWGLLIWAVYALVTNLTRKPGPPDTTHGDARAILDQRLRDLMASGDHQSPAGTGSAR